MIGSDGVERGDRLTGSGKEVREGLEAIFIDLDRVGVGEEIGDGIWLDLK